MFTVLFAYDDSERESVYIAKHYSEIQKIIKDKDIRYSVSLINQSLEDIISIINQHNIFLENINELAA
jgi:hypothetical protein